MKIRRPQLLYILLVAGVIGLPGCFSEINFEGSDGQLDNLVIQGKLIKGTPSLISVSIRTLSSYEGIDIPDPVEVASVSLLDENQEAVELLQVEPGIFELELPDDLPYFEIREGHSYQLKVVTQSDQIYESVLEPMLAVPEPGSIDFKLVEREEINIVGNNVLNTYLNFHINTPLLSTPAAARAYLKWETAGCYRFIETTPANAPIPNPKTCYYKETLNRDKVKVFNGQASSQNDLREHLFLETELDHRFSRGYYLTVYQQAISETAYEYWEQVSQVVERTGGLFEAKPGKIKGNIYNINNPEEEVFGFFYVATQDTIRLRIDPEDVNFPSPYCPVSATPADVIADFCYDCLLWPNSTLEKPDYWEN